MFFFKRKELEEYGIVANYEGDLYVRRGALCYLITTNGVGEHYEFWVISRGGRGITRYIRLSRLYNWRVKWLPPNMRFCRRHTKQAAKEIVEKYKRWFER